ncbi:hypothetical protein HG531_005860 [Fusarium graminearum]|nr:hypothetical protein HG531_005860 [Fusarium graminearum]
MLLRYKELPTTTSEVQSPYQTLHPTSYPDIHSLRLPSQALQNLHRVVSHDQVIPSCPSGSDNLEFHLGKIPAKTSPGTMAERDEGLFLSLRYILPSLRFELIRIRSPHLLEMMNSVDWDAENSTGSEVVSGNCDTVALFRDQARKTEADGGVMPQGFVDDKTEQRCHGATRSISSSNKHSQSLSDELSLSKRLTLVISTLTHTFEKILLTFITGRVVQSVRNARCAKSTQVDHAIETGTEERIRAPLEVRLEFRQCSDCSRNLTSGAETGDDGQRAWTLFCLKVHNF